MYHLGRVVQVVYERLQDFAKVATFWQFLYWLGNL